MIATTLLLLLFIPGFILFSEFVPRSSARSATRNITTVLSMSFAVSVFLLCVVYGLSFGRSLLILKSYMVLSGMTSILWISLSHKKYGAIISEIFANSYGLLAYFLLAALFISTNILLGGNPILFSDTYGHLTIVRRMFEHNSTIFSSGYYPGEIFLLTFGPWHAILASLSLLLGVEPLEVWKVVQVLLPIILVFSYLSFCTELYPPLRKSSHFQLVFGVFFILLFPGVYQLLRGEGDYRVVNNIISFQALRLFWLTWHNKDRSALVVNRVFLLLFCLELSLIHLVEAMFLAITTAFYGSVSLIFQRVRIRKCVELSLFELWLLIVQLGVLLLFFSSIPNPHSIMTYQSFLGDWLSYWKIYLGPPALVALFILPWVLIPLAKNQRLWISATAALATIFGSSNPFLYYLYAKVMKSELAWRTLMLFPTHLIFGFFCYFSWRAKDPRKDTFLSRGALRSIILITMCGSIGYYLNYLWGVNGEVSYFWSDKISQLKLYPKFYEFVRSQNDKIFLGDPFTSVPITTISSNFPLCHRPWNNSDPERQAAHLLIQADLGNAKLKEAIDRYQVNFVFLNQSETPEGLKDESKKYPALYRFKQPDPVNLPDYFLFRGKFDGIQVYETLKK